jgi:hypothetical protein
MLKYAMTTFAGLLVAMFANGLHARSGNTEAAFESPGLTFASAAIHRQSRIIGDDKPSSLQDPVTTRLACKVKKGDSLVIHLVAKKIGMHEEQGDTIMTYHLLLEIPEKKIAEGAKLTEKDFRAFYSEDLMEVPNSLFALDNGSFNVTKSKGLLRAELAANFKEVGIGASGETRELKGNLIVIGYRSFPPPL